MIVEVHALRTWRLMCNHCGTFVPDDYSTDDYSTYVYSKDVWLVDHMVDCKKGDDTPYELLPVWISTFSLLLTRSPHPQLSGSPTWVR